MPGPLAAAHDYSGNYMQDADREPGEMSPADLSPELSKHFRALRMWLPLVLLGVRPFRAALEEKLLLARYFHAGAEAAGFEVGPPPELSVATYRWVPAAPRRSEADRFNQALVDAMRRDGGSSSRLRCWTDASRCGWPRSPSDPPAHHRSRAPGAPRAGRRARGRGQGPHEPGRPRIRR